MAKKKCAFGRKRQARRREVDEGETRTRSCTFTCVMSFLAQPKSSNILGMRTFEIELCATRVVGVVVKLFVVGRMLKKKLKFI